MFLTCFFLLLRKSNVTPDKADDINFLHQCHINKTPPSYFITLFWTKTLQYGEYALCFPIFSMPESPLCLSTALDNMTKLVPTSANSPAVCHVDGSPIKCSTFSNFLKKQICMLDMGPTGRSTHSFCRGGTTYLASCGVHECQIKMLGDWHSDSYKQYIYCPWRDKLEVASHVKAFLLKDLH